MIRQGFHGDPTEGRVAVELDWVKGTVTTFTPEGDVTSSRPMTPDEVGLPTDEAVSMTRAAASVKARSDAAEAVAALVDDPSVNTKLLAALAALAGVVAPEVKAAAEIIVGKEIEVAEVKVP